MTNKFNNKLTTEQISNNVLNSIVAPFYNSNIYKNDYNNFAWENSSNNFLLLKDCLQLNNFPYTYEKINYTAELINTDIFSIDLVDIPIPNETMRINVYLFPKNIEIENDNRDDYFAGSATWFGINRNQKYCKRCKISRTNIKIDITDYVNENNIKNFDNIDIFIEGNGKIIKNDGLYIIYNKDDIVVDGTMKINITI
jgi:hypothetical protein